MDIKSKYEISIWDDTLSNEPEHKLFNIGSNEMDSIWRATEPNLISNINGTNQFTFKMCYSCLNPITGSIESNPYIPYLINERKIKLHYEDKWYDFIIKDIEKSMDGRECTYKCEDQFISELSKQGYNLSFSTDLMNNIDTAENLAAAVLYGTDWTVGTSNVGVEEIENAVYEVILDSSLEAYNQTQGDEPITLTTIPAGARILLFSDTVPRNFDTSVHEIQFLYADTYQTETATSMLVVNADCYVATGIWRGSTFVVDDTDIFVLTSAISLNYRGNRIIKSQETLYNPVFKQTASIYEKDGDFYGAIEKQFTDKSTFVSNILVNGEDFTSTSWWSSQNGNLTYGSSNGKQYMQSVASTEGTAAVLLNNSLSAAANFFPNGLPADGFILNVEIPSGYTSGVELGLAAYFNGADQPRYYPATYDSTLNVYRVVLPSFSVVELKAYNFSFYCKRNNVVRINKVELYAYREGYVRYPIKEEYPAGITLYRYQYPLFEGEPYYESVDSPIGGIQYFEYRVLKPGDIDYDGTVYVEKYCYLITYYSGHYINPDWASEAEYTLIPFTADFSPVYDYSYSRKRSIEVSKSNRFNILQTIAEAFDVWIRFNIEHDSQGNIIDKSISFQKQIGEQLYYGFAYGLDLKDVRRTIKSDAIVTKTIVLPNSNELAPNGSCMIARASQNIPRCNYILNFDYYINQNLMDKQVTTEYLAEFNFWTNSYTTEIDTHSAKLNACQLQKTRLEAQLYVAQNTLNSVNGEIANLNSRLAASPLFATDEVTWTGKDVSDYSGALAAIAALPEGHAKAYEPIVNQLKTGQELLQTKSTYETEVADYELAIARVDEEIEWRQSVVDCNVELLTEIEQGLASLFGRFLQEGTWQSEDYFNDDAYYYDALKVARTSAMPQISYDIDVVRLSTLPEYQLRKFQLGDMTYIEDPEFFGYGYIEGNKVPYREPVVITELSIYLDQPERDSIKVQNYKEAFEDLFQRITATTQSLSYAAGTYERAASVVTNNGVIASGTLQDSINQNADLVISSVNNDVVTDNNGVSVQDLGSIGHKVQLNSNGLFISDDGGATWRNAISYRGITTDLLTAGTIATDKLQIQDGRGFRWDTTGITAFMPTDMWSSNNTYDLYRACESFNPNTYVKFNGYGIYGIDDPNLSFSSNVSLQDVFDKAVFSLTWRGLRIKFDNTTSGLVIDSQQKALIITDHDQEVVKLAAGQSKICGWTLAIDRMGYGSSLGDANSVFLIPAGAQSTVAIADAPLTTKFVMVAGTTFGVDNTGKLWATGAHITGDITANGLLIKDAQGNTILDAHGNMVTLAGWTATKDRLANSDGSYYLAPSGYNNYLLNVKNKFVVKTNGNVNVSGTITSAKSSIGELIVNTLSNGASNVITLNYLGTQGTTRTTTITLTRSGAVVTLTADHNLYHSETFDVVINAGGTLSIIGITVAGGTSTASYLVDNTDAHFLSGGTQATIVESSSNTEKAIQILRPIYQNGVRALNRVTDNSSLTPNDGDYYFLNDGLHIYYNNSWHTLLW